MRKRLIGIVALGTAALLLGTVPAYAAGSATSPTAASSSAKYVEWSAPATYVEWSAPATYVEWSAPTTYVEWSTTTTAAPATVSSYVEW